MASDPLPSRLLIGAIAGIAASVAMTAAMRRLHARLPAGERYPPPPREITEATLLRLGAHPSDEATKDATVAAHMAYGAGAGALMAAAVPRMGALGGALAGVGVWLVSYFGPWPARPVLTPPTDHPARRNGMMVLCHLVWGAVTAAVTRELTAARNELFAAGPLADAKP